MIPRRKSLTLDALKRALLVTAVLCSASGAAAPAGSTVDAQNDRVRRSVDTIVPALMAKDAIPGMAVAVTDAGKSYVFGYGVASINPRTPVTRDTIFELGSISKTFTATLASWAQVRHRLSFADPSEKYLPELQGTPFGKVSLLTLGTHTSGGLPLQVPDGVTNDAQLLQYLKQWQPAYAMGTCRTYSNISIGVLGLITAKSMDADFRSLVEHQLFPALGLHHSFIVVPADQRARYAWGYTHEGTPIRVAPGTLSNEAYGVKTTAADLIRFVQENIDPAGLSPTIGQAIVQTHTGYFRDGPMTQDLIWEQYPYPVPLPSLLDGNSSRMLLQPTPASAIVPPLPPLQGVWVNKTGTTNGFGAYVAFVPSKQLGVVLLANKNYPIPDRVTAAYRILSALGP